MKLSDVVSGSGLAMYAEIALLIFFIVFVIVGLALLLRRNADHDIAARMPLDDGNEPLQPRRRAGEL
jgi:hypothetical protein